MDQPHTYGVSQISLASVYEGVCGESNTPHAEKGDFISNGRDILGTAGATTLTNGEDSRCMRLRHTNDSNFSLPQHSVHHPEPVSLTSSPTTLASFSSARNSAAHCASSGSVLNPTNISYQISTSEFNNSSLQNSQNPFPSINEISNCRTRASSTNESPMFYSALPSRSYAIVPNSITSSVPVLATTARESYTNSAQGFTRSIDYRSPHELSKPFPANRSIYSPHTAMSYAHLSPVYPTSSSYPTEYRTEPGEPTLPFNEEQIIADLVSQDGVSIRPEISCKIEKGFFYSQEHAWTCYRRNYFSVSCSYSLEPQIDCGVLYIKRKNENTDTPEMKPIQALAVNLSASVDGSNGKIVDLVQHTPKRDKGPQLKVTHTKLYPSHKSTSHTTSGAIGSFPPASYGYHTAATPLTNSLHLPLQHLTTQTRETHEAQSAGISFPTPTATAHTFERIQFKNATANNGKRRAQQQYYHLIVELFADVRTDSSAPEEWVKVAQRVSQQVVVRGRSPSHYKNEGPTSNSRTSTSGSLSGRQNAWSPFQGHSSQMYVSSTNGRMLPEPGNYMYHAMPSITEPAASIGHHMINNSAISALEPPRALTANISNGRALFTSHAGPGAAEEEGGGYSYYPQPLYEAGLTTSSGSMMKSDEMTHSGKSSSSPESAAGTFSQPMPGKYAGYETSKGYYPS